MTELHFLGDESVWSLSKTAFLSSDKFGAASVLKSYDWADGMKRAGRCVISGFQSRLERDVFEILLGGGQPIILALSRGLYVKPPSKLRRHIDSGRLLVVSVFGASVARGDRRSAFRRNQFCVDVADEVVVAHIHAGGMLGRLDFRGKRVTALDAGAGGELGAG